MTINIDNIIVGSGDLYIASPTDAYYPGFDLLTQPTMQTNGSHMGATMEGVEVAYEPDYTDIMVDQLKDAAVIYQNGFRVTVRTNLAEATLTNLKLAWGLPESAYSTGAGFQQLNITIPNDEPVERKLVIWGRSPASTGTTLKRRKYYCRRAVSVDASGHALKRAEATMFPVSFRILADPVYSLAQYGYIYDET